MTTLNPPYRIAIIGCSGAGKSTLAGHLAKRFAIPHVELDGLYHGPNWEPARLEDFQAATLERTGPTSQWVACGNYDGTVGADLRSRANYIVFLDLPKRVVMTRMLRRSLGRVITRKELWNGNRERWRNLFHREPEENIVPWAWTRWAKYRRQFRGQMEAGGFAHAHVLHFTRASQVRRWLLELG